MGNRKRIALACELCAARNYKTTKGPKAESGERLRIKKFCPTCGQHTWHGETK